MLLTEMCPLFRGSLKGRFHCSFKLKHKYTSNNVSCHFYFSIIFLNCRILSLDWTVITVPASQLKSFWSHFLLNVNLSNLYTFHIMCPCTKRLRILDKVMVLVTGVVVSGRSVELSSCVEGDI